MGYDRKNDLRDNFLVSMHKGQNWGSGICKTQNRKFQHKLTKDNIAKTDNGTENSLLFGHSFLRCKYATNMQSWVHDDLNQNELMQVRHVFGLNSRMVMDHPI